MHALEAFERVFGPEARETLANVSNLAELYHNQGRYDESERLQRRALEVNERILGRDHPETLTSLNNIAGLYQTLGRYDDAEPLYRRVIEASDRVRGKDHPDTLTALNNLASLYEAQGRYSEAELLSRRVLETGERALGVEHPDTLRNLNNLAALLDARGRSSEAEALYRRALEASERVLGREHPHTLSSVDNLALLYQTMGRYSDAERLFGRALEASERVLGREHPDTLRCLSNLALLYEAQGNYDQAETIFLQVLTAMERVLGREHPATLLSVNNLAALYEIGGRYAEAEPLYLRALEAEERVLGRTHPQTLASINNLAFLYQVQGRYIDAEPLHHRALEDNERLLGREHPNTLMSVNSLAGLYQAAGRHNEAEPLYRRALEVSERLRGKEHPDTLTTMNNLGTLYQVQGRYSEAEPLLHRALEAKERVLGSEHPDVLSTVNNLALLHSAQGGWLRATQYWQRSTAVIAARTRRGALNPQQPRGAKKSEVDRSSWQFRQLVKAMHQLVRRSDDPGDVTASAAFMTAQWALGSEAAQSMKQMAARSAKGDPALAALARERQDKLGEWQALDVWRSAMLGKGASKRDTKAEAEVSAKLAALDRRIEEIDALFTAKFPDYFAVINPEPVSVKDVQAQLGADEALVLFLDTVNLLDVPEETFVWVVTRTQMRWVRSELGTVALAREVDALRCGLDTAAWSQPSDCPQLTGQSRAGERLPFDQARAHRLYTTLFGGAEDIIRGKHLLIVPSGALTQLPFAVLVTAPPQGRDHRLAAWLVRDHAITVLPAVSSLKALRVTGHTSAATKPLTGFGNPLLDGADSRSKSAALARQTQSCPKSLLRQAVEFLGVRRGTAPVRMRNGLAEPADLRRLEPLPETADELCAVARAFGAEDSDIHLGIRASEREVKEMSQRGELAQYRIVHFATHGAMAGELKSSNEPGLVLTPPEQASETDDGYLTASEITGLKLDADWVILSACNTAAGQATSAEALSGLARAFIYAQARALLVSHWAVDSNATVKLITFAMREMPRDKTVGRAEALRRAMLALIDKGEAHEAHPAYWAPFIVVGEGAS